jgi:hypothetical protein
MTQDERASNTARAHLRAKAVQASAQYGSVIGAAVHVNDGRKPVPQDRGKRALKSKDDSEDKEVASPIAADGSLFGLREELHSAEPDWQ